MLSATVTVRLLSDERFVATMTTAVDQARVNRPRLVHLAACFIRALAQLWHVPEASLVASVRVRADDTGRVLAEYTGIDAHSD